MRPLALIVLLLVSAPALAADWSHYVNERFGFTVDIPPGFVAGPPPANGDGLSFKTPTARLDAFGALIIDTDFEGNIAQRQKWAADDGWALTYEASTPGWASYSGKRGDRIVYARAIPICDGSAIAMFELQYSSIDLKAFDPVITRLVASLKDGGAGWQC